MKAEVIIIDDEPLAISLVKSHLKQYDDFEVTDECLNGFEGLKAILKSKPDLVFLDIQMPKLSGFEMLELLDEPPNIIFVTAYDEFAIKAFEANALDYLLKPFSTERFDAAVQKFRDQFFSSDQEQRSKASVPRVQIPHENRQRLAVREGNEIRLIPFEEITFVEAYDDYVKINIRGNCFLKKQTMVSVEASLPSNKFLRVHRSFIVNMGEITRIEASGKESHLALLRDKTRVPLSKTGYAKLKQALGI